MAQKYDRKLLRYLSNSLWYHATTLEKWHNICKIGLKADYNIDHSHDLDFGYGFYLTDTQERAENYIERLIRSEVLGDSIPVIIEFNFIPLFWFEEDDYKTFVLNKPDDEFGEFVFKNRTQNKNGCAQHEYDIIYGVMSDSFPTKLLIDYEMGLISKENVIDGIKRPNSMKQLSLHKQEICDIIRPQRAYTLDVATKERKELDVNVYKHRIY